MNIRFRKKGGRALFSFSIVRVCVLALVHAIASVTYRNICFRMSTGAFQGSRPLGFFWSFGNLRTILVEV